MRAFVIGLGLALAAAAAIVAQASKTPRQLVDLNHATLLELMQLPGVGPSRAEAIVRHRDAHPFRRTADLLRIKGIGRRTFARLRPFVTVGQPATGPAVAAPAVREAAPAAKVPAARGPTRAAKAPVVAIAGAKPLLPRQGEPRAASPKPAVVGSSPDDAASTAPTSPRGTPPRRVRAPGTSATAGPVCDTGAGSPQACPVPWRSEHSGATD